MTDIEKIDLLISNLRRVKSEIKRKERLSQNRADMSMRTHTQKRIQKAEADLNWQCMEVDKSKIDFARLFKGSLVDVSTAETTFNPSPFHSYKY